MGCNPRVIVQPSVTDVIVQDTRPTTTTVAPVSKVVRTGSQSPVRRIETKGQVIINRDTPRVVELGTPGPEGPQGPPGPAGGTTIDKIADRPLGGQRIVRSTGSNSCDYADSMFIEQGDDVLGLTLGAASTGQTAYIVDGAEVVEPSWNWVEQEPLYLAENGLMTQTPPPPEAAFTLVVGFATSPTSAMIRIETPIYH